LLTKVCSACGEEKALSEFHKAHGKCKKCYNAARRNKRATDPEYREKERERDCTHKKNRYATDPKFREKRLEYDRARVAIPRRYVYDYLKSNPCVDCGETDPVVLEFDHKNPEDKTANISNMVYKGHKIETIQKEIDKCEVRCANCHRRRTAAQLGWKILEFSEEETSYNPL